MTFTTFAKFYVVFKWLIFVFITALKDCLTCFCPSLLLLSLEGNEQEWGLGVGWGLMAGGWGDQIKTCPSFTGIPGAHRERERALTFHNWLLTQLNYFQLSLCFLWIAADLCFFSFFSSTEHMWDLSFPTRDGTGAPAMEAWSLNHWTAREFPHRSDWPPDYLSDLISRKIFLQCKFEEMRKSLPGAPSGPAALSPTTLLLYPSAWNALFLLSGFHRSAWSVYPPHPASRPFLSTLRT